MPNSSREVEWLRTRGIRAILSLTETPIPSSWLGGIEYRHAPIKNHAAPSIDALNACIGFVLEQVSSQSKVMVHCAAGRGRTGIVLAAYRCARYGETPDVAIEKIRTMRKGSIERKLQEKVIHEYYESIIGKNKSK